MWDIHSQTKMKLAILEKYLAAWATILKERSDVLYYIDGFAGPGWYNDPETKTKVAGSPIRAVQIYVKHKKDKGWKYELRFINVEKDSTTFNELQKETSKFEKDAKITNIEGEFLDNLDKILREIEGYNSFFFMDPFGISGIEFDQLTNVLKRPKTEILMKFSYNEFQRCLGQLKNCDDPDITTRNKARKTIERVSRMMGIETEHLSFLQELFDNLEKEEGYLATYLKNLRKCKRFVYPFKINFPGSQRTFFYLILLTDNITGLKIMKDIMYAEEHRELRQLVLFPEKRPIEFLADEFTSHYSGRSVPYNRILEDWLPISQYINGADYLEKDVRDALKLLELRHHVRPIKKSGYKYPLYIFKG